jgi:hypothetical protein
LDAYTVTSINSLISEITGGQVVADAMINKWVSAFRQRTEGAENISADFGEDRIFGHPLHRRIKDEFDLVKNRVQAKTTIFDACVQIVKNSGWGPRQEAVLKAATVQDFVLTIKTLETSDLKRFMRQFMSMGVEKQNYVQPFGSAMDHFIEACRIICADPQANRLAKLIRVLFEDAKLTPSLELKVEDVPAAVSVTDAG